jgi:hypothetical protein
MARVRVEDIVDHLSSQMRKALEAAVREVHPNAAIDPHALFRSFRRAVGRKCNTWEQVPDRCVET